MLMPILVLKRWDIDGMQIGQRKHCLVLVVDQNLETYHLHVDADLRVRGVGRCWLAAWPKVSRSGSGCRSKPRNLPLAC